MNEYVSGIDLVAVLMSLRLGLPLLTNTHTHTHTAGAASRECINSSIIYHGEVAAAYSVNQVAAASSSPHRPVTVCLTAAVIYKPPHCHYLTP